VKYLYFVLILLFAASCTNSVISEAKYQAMAGTSNSGGTIGYSNVSLEEAKQMALNNCKNNKKKWSLIDFTGECYINRTYINPKYPGAQDEIALIKKKEKEQKLKEQELAKERELENEYGRYIQQCEYIGFKKNTDKMGECVLQMYNTEIKLAQLNTQQRRADSTDVLTNMFLLNESLKLLNPPQQRTTTCQARPFGSFMNIYCN